MNTLILRWPKLFEGFVFDEFADDDQWGDGSGSGNGNGTVAYGHLGNGSGDSHYGGIGYGSEHGPHLPDEGSGYGDGNKGDGAGNSQR